MKNSFLVYHDYKYIFEDLSNEDLGLLFRAIFEYEINRTEPNFTGIMKMAFRMMKQNLDRDRDKYDKRCETSAENGKLGGRPKKPNSKPNENLKKPKKPDNDNDIVNENDNDIDTDAENVNGTSADLSVAEESETNADLFTFEDEEETSADLFNFVEGALGRTLNSIEIEQIGSWKDNDMTRYAVKESVLNGARGIRYIETVLSSWEAKGFKTVEDVKAYQEKYKKDKNSQNQGKRYEEEQIIPDWFEKEYKREDFDDEIKRRAEQIRNGTYEPSKVDF